MLNKEIEILTGIKRLYIPELDLTQFKGQPGKDKTPILKHYLNKNYYLKVKEIFDIVRSESSFGYYVYYRG